MKSSRREAKQREGSLPQQQKSSPGSKPFTELGSIFTPDYLGFKFDELVSEEKIKPAKFFHENQPYAKFTYKPTAADSIAKIVSYDFDYIQKETQVLAGDSISLFEFALCSAATDQIVSSVDHKDKFSLIGVAQELQTKMKLPKIWNDWVHSLGNRVIPYGLMQLGSPVQTVIDMLLHGLTKVAQSEAYLKVEADVAPHERLQFDPLFASLRDPQLTWTGCHYIALGQPDSTEFLKTEAARIWNDEFGGKTVDLKREIAPGNFVPFTVALPTSDFIADRSKNIDITKFQNDMVAMGMNVSRSNRMVGLVNGIRFGELGIQFKEVIPEFCMVRTSLRQVMAVAKVVLRTFARLGQPILDRLYQLEEFRPTGKGSIAQLVVNGDNGRTFTTKVNLPKYPLALGCILDVTAHVEIVRQSYVTHTQLDESYGSVFVLRDSTLMKREKG